MKPVHIASTAGVIAAGVFSVVLFAQEESTLRVENETITIFHESNIGELSEEARARLGTLHEHLAGQGELPEGELGDHHVIRVHRVTDGSEPASQNFTWNAQSGQEPRLSYKFIDTPLAQALYLLSMTRNPPRVVNADFELIEAFEAEAEEIEIISNDEPGQARFTRVLVKAGEPVTDLENMVVIEDPAAHNILVSVEAENKTMTEIIDLISVNSGCNIYINGEEIVVDRCGN